MNPLFPIATVLGLFLVPRRRSTISGIYKDCPLESYGFSTDVAKNIRRYGGAAMKAAAEQGINPDLLMGQVMVESGWNPSAVSKTGAVGLVQIMPGTGEFISKKSGLPNDRRSPVNNLRMAAWLIRYLYGQWNGDWTLVFAAYLGGSGNVQKHLNNTGTIPSTYSNYANRVFKWYSKFAEIRANCS